MPSRDCHHTPQIIVMINECRRYKTETTQAWNSNCLFAYKVATNAVAMLALILHCSRLDKKPARQAPHQQY
jgi:hypothetical protein